MGVGQSLIDISKCGRPITTIMRENGVGSSWPLKEALIRLSVISTGPGRGECKWLLPNPETMDEKVFKNMLSGVLEKIARNDKRQRSGATQ